LQPISVAKAPWKQVIIDFILKLPKNKGHKSILVVVEKTQSLCILFQQMRELVPMESQYYIRSMYKNIMEHFKK